LKIGLGDTEVDVANIEAVEGGAVSTRSGTTLRWSSSAILLCLGELGDDRDTFELLSSQLESLRYRLLVFELDITDAGV
jgi:hypothetical protein